MDSKRPILSESSSAQEVREYFEHVLVHEYSIPDNFASKYASKWTYGKGKEVASFDIETYRQIFGTQIGSILYTNKPSYMKQQVRKAETGWDLSCELTIIQL
jgi:hypothetical protein